VYKLLDATFRTVAGGVCSRSGQIVFFSVEMACFGASWLTFSTTGSLPPIAVVAAERLHLQEWLRKCQPSRDKIVNIHAQISEFSGNLWCQKVEVNCLYLHIISFMAYMSRLVKPMRRFFQLLH